MPRDGSRIEPHFGSDELWAEETLKPFAAEAAYRSPLSREPRRRDRVMMAILSALAVLGSATVLAAAFLL